MIGGFVAATVVALLQYLRSRDRRLLLLTAMFLLQAFSLTREWWDAWKDISQGAVCLVGVALVLTLGPARPPARRPEPPTAPRSSGRRRPPLWSSRHRLRGSGRAPSTFAPDDPVRATVMWRGLPGGRARRVAMDRFADRRARWPEVDSRP